MSIATIDALIRALEQARETLGGDAGVRMAYQPHWPLRATVAYATVAASDDPYDEDEQAPGKDRDAGLLWLAAGGVPYDENPYAPRWAWQQGEAGGHG